MTHVAKLSIGLALGLGLLAATIARSQEKPKAPDAKAPAMDPAMMAEMERLGKPGPEHAMLAKYAGDFTADVQMWMDPAQPAMKSTGKLHNEMGMGGRYLMGTFDGTMMGTPFHGMSCTGYDNGKKKWFNGWIDDMSTGLMAAEGDADASGKVVTLSGDMYCPQTKGIIKARQVNKFTDADTMTLEMYTPDASGKEFKSMEITYKRVKG